MADVKSRARTKKPANKKPRIQAKESPRKGGLFGSNKANAGSAENSREAVETVAGNGTVVLSKAALLGRIVAWTLVAFVVIASVITVIQLMNPRAQTAQAVAATDGPATQQAGDYARGFVGAWLRATRDDAQQLARYKSIASGEITATESVQFRDLAIASAELEGNGIATVVVSAEVLTPIEEQGQVTGAVETKNVWVPTWFQVNVQHENGLFTALGWPAPIPTPKTAIGAQAAYTYEASADVKATVDAFFRAYALDEGEVNRMTHPESAIEALGPNPYTAVKVLKITTDKDFEDKIPADGTSTRALIDLALGTGPDAFRAATYSMTLETRGGRWEIRALDPAPLVSPSNTNSTTSTSQVTE